MSAKSALGGQLQHLGAKRSKHALWLSHRRRREIHAAIHRIEIGDHRAVWLVIRVAVHAFDHWLMAGANAEQEPIREGLGECLPSGLHGHRSARMHAGDTRANDERLGSRQQQRRARKRFAANGLGHPHRLVTKRFDFGNCLARTRHRLHIELECP